MGAPDGASGAHEMVTVTIPCAGAVTVACASRGWIRDSRDVVAGPV